ncbi:hypothetical protein OY671_012098, partial [Metschnikowia pulcherrima]
ERGRLFHHDRVRPGQDARQVARHDGGSRRHGFAGLAAGGLAGGAGIRLARDVRARRRRRADRSVSAQVAAGIAASARGCWPYRGGRGADAGDRKGSRPRPALAGAGGRRNRHRFRRHRHAVHSAAAVAHDRGIGSPDHHQHAAVRFRHSAAGVL